MIVDREGQTILFRYDLRVEFDHRGMIAGVRRSDRQRSIVSRI